MQPVFTIGHSTRQIDEFTSLLKNQGIDTLVDIRRYPGSKRYPHFSKEQLPQKLKEARIEYIHEVDLGGRRTASQDSENSFWKNAQFRGYADHMDTPEFRAALGRIIARAKTHRQAVMCAEAVPWRCHRQLLADALVACEVDVVHIIGPNSTKPHELNPAARVLPNGHLIYPASSQTELL